MEEINYEDMLEFVTKIQEEIATEYDKTFKEYKETEHKIREQELLKKEYEKRRSPNISLFSPISTDDFYSDQIKTQEEIEKWSNEKKKLKAELDSLKKKKKDVEQLQNFLCKEKEGRTKQENLSKEMDSCYKKYSAKLLEIKELDRNRIARDLHDSTVQNLTGLIHKTELCSKLIDIDIVRTKLELQTMKSVLKETIDEMREIIYDLRPMALNNLGLTSAVEALCEHIQKSHSICFSIKSKGDEEEEISSVIRISIYRIIQEACNNIIKHSKASKCSIAIQYEKNSIEVNIKDNGVGFDLKPESKSNNELYGFGLSTMRERANLINGTIEINSVRDKGTEIKINIPK